jgi:hypothetical protein
MRAVMGVAGLLVVLAIVGVLAKKQLAATKTPVTVLQVPGQPAPTGTVREQSQQVQQQVKQQVEGLMQQARPMPEDEPK